MPNVPSSSPDSPRLPSRSRPLLTHKKISQIKDHVLWIFDPDALSIKKGKSTDHCEHDSDMIEKIQMVAKEMKEVAQQEIKRYFADGSYSAEDFEQRLLIDEEDKAYEESKRRIISDPEIMMPLVALKKLIAHLPQQQQSNIVSRAEKEYLETWIITRHTRSSSALEKTFHVCDQNFTQLSDTEILWVADKIRKSSHVYLEHCHLGTLNLRSFTILVMALQHATIIDLSKNNLGSLDETRLRIMMSGIRNGRKIVLRWCRLHRLDKRKLHILAEWLQWAKSLDIGHNQLDKFGKDELAMLLTKISNARSLGLETTGIGLLDKRRIEIVARSIQNTIRVDLSNNNLHLLGPRELKILMKHI